MLTKEKHIDLPYDIVEFENGKQAEIIHFESAGHIIECQQKYNWKSKHLNNSQQEWRFGTEFPDIETTKEAVIAGECSDKTREQVEYYRDIMLNMDEIQESMRRASTFKRKRIFSDFGSELDIDRVLSGDQNHWQRMTKGRQSNSIKIAVNISVSCGHSEEQIHKLAALTSVTADMLQRCGLSVEILGICSAYNITTITSKQREQGFTFKIKSASDKLDISRVASSGIPGLYRAYGFNTWVNTLDGKETHGLGRAEQTTQNLKDLLNIKHLIEVKWVKEGKEKQFLSNILKDLNNKTLIENGQTV